MLFNEPKLLKSPPAGSLRAQYRRFSALQRAEIAEIRSVVPRAYPPADVSVLFNEPKLLKFRTSRTRAVELGGCFSALQRAEIAEI